MTKLPKEAKKEKGLSYAEKYSLPSQEIMARFAEEVSKLLAQQPFSCGGI